MLKGRFEQRLQKEPPSLKGGQLKYSLSTCIGKFVHSGTTRKSAQTINLKNWWARLCADGHPFKGTGTWLVTYLWLGPTPPLGPTETCMF